MIHAIAGEICLVLAGCVISICDLRPEVHEDEVGRQWVSQVFYISDPASLGNDCGPGSKSDPWGNRSMRDRRIIDHVIARQQQTKRGHCSRSIACAINVLRLHGNPMDSRLL